ncbi:MAG: SDR family oxidoreductase [Gemmatimonadetes bacterium]|nr:SDR family oxidoreductase [Gemmatimonadota bacterium]
MDPFTLKGKRALVTGGTRGIGAAVARLLARAGADVCVGYRSRHEDAAAMRDELTALGVKGVSLAADLGSSAGAKALVEHCVRELGGIEILVHSAGIWPVAEVSVQNMDDERWARTMRENVDATFFVTRAAAHAMMAARARATGMGGSMRASGQTPATGVSHVTGAAGPTAQGVAAGRTLGNRYAGGRIVLIASTAGQRGEAFHADYGASKGAMIALVKSVAVELAPFDITVNAVAPGWVDTDMCAEPFANGGKERIAAGIPVGRIASPDDIAFPTVSLCFDGARHITGEILNVNGGSVLCG